MAARIARSDVVGSLLRPDYLRDARKAARDGALSGDALRAVEDRAVREAVALQESAGLDVVTDGELRRSSWVVTIPLRPEGIPHAPLAGYEFLPADAGWWSLWKEPDGRKADVWTVPTRPFVTKPITVVRDLIGQEYAFLKATATARTKITVPAPSWHRIFWHPQYSRAAYPTPEDFLRAIAAYLREHVVKRVIALGGDYVQMDAPNYAQWHVDPSNRAAFESWGHDMAKELIADAEVDDLVFAGIDGITRAMHVCRGNAPGGRWLANGGYESIAPDVFPRLTNYDRLLLEFDTPRAGGFAPLRFVPKEKGVVLGLVSSKTPVLETLDTLKKRADEAARYVDAARLGISPQCGFASTMGGNPVTEDDERAKLTLCVDAARTLWG